MILFTSEVEAKKFALLHARNIAMIVNPNNPSSETDIKDVQKAASSVAQQLRIFRATSEQEIDASFEALSLERADAVLVAHDPFSSVGALSLCRWLSDTSFPQFTNFGSS